MTTFTFSTADLSIGAVVTVALALGFILCCAFGVFRFSLSIGAVPPWNRKPAAKKTTEPATAAGEAPVAGSAPKPVRKVS